MGEPPFANQLDVPDRQESVHRQFEEVKQRLKRDGYKAAADALRRALEKDPADYLLHWDFAGVLNRQGDSEEEVRATRMCIKAAPHHADAYFRLAWALKRLRRFDESLARAADALRVEPDRRVEFLNLKGVTLMDMNKLPEAIAVLSQAVELQPEHHLNHTFLGRAFAANGQFDLALNAFNRSLAIKADDAETHYDLAHCTFKRKCCSRPGSIMPR